MMHADNRWVQSVVAGVAIVFGGVALGKPYWTLEHAWMLFVLVAAMLLVWRGALLHRAMLGTVVVTAMVVLLFSERMAMNALVYGLLILLVIAGLSQLRHLRTGAWILAIYGLSLVLLGLLGVYWLDVSSIFIGLLIAPALLLGGARLLWHTWRQSATQELGHVSHGRMMQIFSAAGSILLLMITLFAGYGTVQAVRTAPTVDAFANYDLPIGDRPGVLLKAEPFNRTMPENSIAHRILYTTTGLNGEIVLATAVVYLPANTSDEPLPVILWAHGTTGVAEKCAPSLLQDPFGAGAMLFPDRPLDEGWAIVVPDYLGLGASAPHPYLVGKPTAHSSLDAVRAAQQVDFISLSEDTVVWGHSQGGAGSLWIGLEAPTYAPDVPLLGVAAVSPASYLTGFIDSLVTGEAGPIFGGYIIRGFADAYDDVVFYDYIRPGARFAQETLVSRCLSEKGFLVSIVTAVIREPFYLKDPHTGPLFERFKENIPLGTFVTPVFLAQGEADPLVLPEVQFNYVAELCDSGQIVEYHTYAGKDHMGIMAEDSPMVDDLMTWTADRFAHEPGPESCTHSAP